MKKLFLILLFLCQSTYSMHPTSKTNIWHILNQHKFDQLRDFLQAGGCANVVNSDRMTPLHQAAAMQDHRFAQLLVIHGANLNARNTHGWTPLHYASRNNRPQIIQLLVDQNDGIDLDAPTSSDTQDTALHLAIYKQHIDATRTLLQAGANPRATNIHKQTPLHELCIARREGNPSRCVALAELLISHAIQKGCYPDDYIFALDNTGKKATDYLEDDEQELTLALRSQQEIAREKLQLMLKQHNLSLIHYLRNQELGLLTPR